MKYIFYGREISLISMINQKQCTICTFVELQSRGVTFCDRFLSVNIRLRNAKNIWAERMFKNV